MLARIAFTKFAADVARATRNAAGNCRIAGVPLEALQARLAVRVSVAVPRARPALSCAKSGHRIEVRHRLQYHSVIRWN